MLLRLGDEDGQAVDLLLDKTAIAGQSTMYADPGNHGFDRRVHSVSGLLKLLDLMPAGEPPPDLMVRTLQRIEERGFRAAAPGVDAHVADAPIGPNVQLDPRRPR